MTIHHDKLAYGKLASSREDISDDKLKKMLELLNAEGDCPEDIPQATAEGEGEGDADAAKTNAAKTDSDKKKEKR